MYTCYTIFFLFLCSFIGFRLEAVNLFNILADGLFVIRGVKMIQKVFRRDTAVEDDPRGFIQDTEKKFACIIWDAILHFFQVLNMFGSVPAEHILIFNHHFVIANFMSNISQDASASIKGIKVCLATLSTCMEFFLIIKVEISQRRQVVFKAIGINLSHYLSVLITFLLLHRIQDIKIQFIFLL